jgi:hypothetical protein
MQSTPHTLVPPGTSGCDPNPVTYPLTHHQETELARLGLRSTDFHVFVDHFVGHRFNYIVRELSDRSWRSAGKRLLRNGHLVSHLAGERFLGTGARWDRSLGAKGRHVTSYVIIDLDFHGDMEQLVRESVEHGATSTPEWRDLLHRYDDVCRALGSPSIVFRSSESGGLHLYYLLTHLVELHDLRTPSGDRGAVIRLLRAHGLDETPGRVEVYPRGQYRVRGQKNRVRLPFGRGCVALDSELNRITTGTPLDDLRAIVDRLERGAITLIDPEYWTEEAANLPRADMRRCSPSKASRPRKTEPPGDESDHNVSALWRDGLTGPRQLNDALWALAGDLRRRGVSIEEARARLSDWLDRRHNGFSRTYNASRPIAHEEVGEVIGRRFALTRHVGGWGDLPGLSEWEAASLIAATCHDHQLADPQTGEVLSRFKVQHLGFELLRRSKQWVLREIRWRIADFHGDEQAIRTGVRSESDLASQVTSFWPDPSQPQFIVPVPYRLRLNIPGVGKDAQWSHWRVLQNAGLYQGSRKASAEAHRAATYHVALDFGGLSDHPVELPALDVALKKLLAADDVHALYSRHYAKRVRRADGPSLAGGDDIAIATIQSLLRFFACNTKAAA